MQGGAANSLVARPLLRMDVACQRPNLEFRNALERGRNRWGK
jgi:hypothetical protein